MAQKTQSDIVQIFDIGEALKNRETHRGGRVDMASSLRSYVAVFRTPPRGGETHIHQHPDSDQILCILKGELTVEGDVGKTVIKTNQGVLIPAGSYYGFTNTASEEVIFLSMRTESVGGRRSAYVENVSSDLTVKIPLDGINAQGLGPKIYLYTLSRTKIGIAATRLEEWNKKSLIRMDCEHETSGEELIVRLPKRAAEWYELEKLGPGDYEILPQEDRTRVSLNLKPKTDHRP